MKSRPPCLEWREKLALRHEDLSTEDQQALDAHVASCKTCATALADYHFFEARLDALPPPAIKPLPRLSPHFFEQTGRPRANDAEKEKSDALISTRVPPVRKASRQRGNSFVGRFLSVAAIACLLLASVVLFRGVYLARVAEHPGGNTLLNLNQHTEAVASVAWSPDNTYIATASWDHTVKVWIAQTGELLCSYAASDEVYALAWSPNSQFIASGGGDNSVHIWDPSNCKPTGDATHIESGPVASIAWSPNGTEIASGGWDHSAQVWNVSTGKILQTLPANDVVSSIAWSPDGKYIAVGSWDEYVRIWTANGELLQEYHYNEAVNAVAWSPRAAQPYLLAVGDEDGTVEVRNWNILRSAPVWTYTGYLNAINAVAWSPNGEYLALGGNAKTVQVWNPFTQKRLITYTGHTNTISSLAWSPDGKEIVSGSFDSTAKVWKVVG